MKVLKVLKVLLLRVAPKMLTEVLALLHLLALPPPPSPLPSPPTT